MSANDAATDRGRTIEDPVTGERITFVETAEESGGTRLVIRLALAPGGAVMAHAHPEAETFECVQGQVRFQLTGRWRRLDVGSTVTAPPRTVHGFRNASDVPATLRVVATPGAPAEHGLRVKFALSRDGFLRKDGPPRDLLLGAIVLHRSRLYLPPLPVWLYRPLIAALAALGRWRGKERYLLARYAEYARLLDARGGCSPKG